MEVLELIVRGSNKEIAATLNISEATVKSHINNLSASSA
jgi:DNA-binding NarL/FixJ family response regulator